MSSMPKKGRMKKLDIGKEWIQASNQFLSHSEELLRKSSVYLQKKLTAFSQNYELKYSITTTISYSSRIFDYNCVKEEH